MERAGFPPPVNPAMQKLFDIPAALASAAFWVAALFALVFYVGMCARDANYRKGCETLNVE